MIEKIFPPSFLTLVNFFDFVKTLKTFAEMVKVKYDGDKQFLVVPFQ